ncbi:hypothetical protein ACYSNM_06710 [Myroides sp. LJL116]
MKRNTKIFLVGIILLIATITLFALGFLNDQTAYFFGSVCMVMIAMPIVIYIFNKAG